MRLLFVLLVTINVWADVPMHPDPNQTPGSFCTENDPTFHGYRYAERIPYCDRSVSSRRKALIYEAYGIPERCRYLYTIDHMIPLALGGSNKNENLWPEHRDIKATRQNLELELYEALRDGRITWRVAIEEIEQAKFNPPSVHPRDCE